MKRAILILLVSGAAILCYSQEEIELKFNLEKKYFETKTEKECFKAGKNYTVTIRGINSAVIGYRIKSKSFALSSPIPEVLKPVFPSLTEEVVIGFTGAQKNTMGIKENIRRNSSLYIEAKKQYEKLQSLKSMSDSLYDYTKTKANPSKACNVMHKLENMYNVKTVDELRNKVILSSKYIIAVHEIYKKSMADTTDQKNIDEYNNLSLFADILNAKNYVSYVNFIQNSVDATNEIIYKPVKAEKDVVDLNILFTDKYTRDTVYNSSVSLYTYGNLSLDFSSGFFYNTIYEKQYYLDSIFKPTAVLTEENLRFDVSIGALGNLCYKFSNYFRAGINMGIAVSPFDGKFRYLLGGSFMFGRKYQLGINMGLALAKIKVLSGGLESNDKGYYVKPGVTAIPMYEKVQPGFYMGFTYNLISTKK
jgi:hypothetical protein